MDDRLEIDAALVARLIRKQFPQWAHLPIERVPLDGWDNRTFRLGSGLKVRLPSASRYVAQVEKEQRWLPRLAPRLPVAIPEPVAVGTPDDAYPWPWSVQRWLEGETAALERIADPHGFAIDVAGFLQALHGVDATDGPAAGPHNFFRGGPLRVYDEETRRTIDALGAEVDADAAMAVWETALASSWQRSPLWIHGDVAVGNLLLRDGRLHAVIDFGNSGVGDPACDLVIAWTFLAGEARDAFRDRLSLDAYIWARARGWALWKALLVIVGHGRPNPAERAPRCIVADVLAEHRACG